MPVQARQPLIDGEMPAGEAMRAILHSALAQVEANIGFVKARESEGLHQLRVGLRRLRIALKMGGTAKLIRLDARAKAFLNQVGPARDLDVFLSESFEPAAQELGTAEGFDELRRRAVDLRNASWDAAVTTVAGDGFHRFQDSVAAAADTFIWPDAATIGAVAPVILDKALRRARKRGRGFAALTAADRHRLRIALKRLRYSAEFLAPLYAKAAVRAWLEPLKELQDMLGHLNDVAEVRGVMEKLVKDEGSAVGRAAALVETFHQARAEAFAVKTGKRWKKFRTTEPFWV